MLRTAGGSCHARGDGHAVRRELRQQALAGAALSHFAHAARAEVAVQRGASNRAERRHR